MSAALQAGDSPLQMGPKREESSGSNTNPLSFLFNFIVGTLAGSYYFFLVSQVTSDDDVSTTTCKTHDSTYEYRKTL